MMPTNPSDMANPRNATGADGAVLEKSSVASKNNTIIATPNVAL